MNGDFVCVSYPSLMEDFNVYKTHFSLTTLFTIRIKMTSWNVRASSLLVWLLIFVYSFKPNSSSVNSSSVLCLESERRALLRFKQDLIVPSNRLKSWNASQPDCCKWEEVECNNVTGHIKVLALQNPYEEEPILYQRDFLNSKLQGKINPCLFELKYLEFLEMSNNMFSGNLPQNLGTLRHLVMIDVSYNMLEGIVSQVHFRNLTNLRILIVSNNNLSLKMDSNWVPPFQLKWLDMSHSSVGPEFPPWLQTQHDLYYLDLSCTGISRTIPSWFWNLSSHINYLNLSHNEINGELPSSLGDSTKPQFESYIFLSSNKFVGRLPRISGNIVDLDLSNNAFSGSMSVLLCNPMSQVNGLKMLHLGKNNLSGNIPDCWEYWQSLEVIILDNNHLTGNIPNSISHLSELHSLHLRNNNLFGEIPTSLRNCSWLKALDLGFNHFFGKMPAWLGSFRHLIVLALPSNNLEGNIPLMFCHLISLQILDLSENNLSGTIPKCINNFTAMAIAPNFTDWIVYSGYENSFIENAFVGTKGQEYQYDTILAMLTSIDLSMNKLSGNIPGEITDLLDLRYLNLSGNELTGEIPNNLGVMRALESFDISRNKISGRIPPSMSSMHFLNNLNLSRNNLVGEIPLATQLQSFNSSSFAGNRLCGPPLILNCSVHDMRPKASKESLYEGGGTEGFHLAMVLGFVVGFWSICGSLLYSRSWRISYYGFLNTAWCRLCVKWQLMLRFYYRG